MSVSSPHSRFFFSLQEGALIVATIIWGGSYWAMEHALHFCGPLFFVGARFLLATLLTGLLFHRALVKISKRDFYSGFAIGVPVCLGQVLQTIGLQSITIHQSAFLTALYVPVVPLLQWLLMHKAPTRMVWAGLGCAFTGLMLLSLQGAKGVSFSTGDCLTLLAALACAGEIVFISHFAAGTNTACVTMVQLLTTSLLSFLFMPLLGENLPHFSLEITSEHAGESWSWGGPVIGLGIASVGLQLAMNWAQKSISPTRATIIYAGEPVWGGVFGRLAGESLPANAILGAGFIIAGVIISELKPSACKKHGPEKT